MSSFSKRLLIGLAVAGLSFPAFAQQELPEYIQARQWTPDVAENMLFSYTIRPNYFPESANFWYEFQTTQGKKWYIVEPALRSKRPLFDNDDMAAQLTLMTGDPYDAQHLPIKGLKLKKDDPSIFTFTLGTQDFEYQYKLATTDGLTELYNHRYFQEQMLANIETSKRYKRFQLQTLHEKWSIFVCWIRRTKSGIFA